MSYRNVRPPLRKAGLAAGAVMLVMAQAGPAIAAPKPVGNVQKAMEEVAKAPGVVGAVGGAYVDGKAVGSGSGGSRLLDGKGGRIPANARFRIGSQTKQMVATVVLQLVEDGRFGVDDKLGDLLPVVVEQDLVERADEITVRQLLRHTSGIPDWYAAKPNPDGSEGEDPSFDVFDFTTRYRPLDLVQWSRDRPRTGEPGEKWSYSNTNYTLLGMIVERSTGHGLAAELHRRLFGPVGMARTYLPVKPPEGIKGPHGHGYYPDAGGRPRDVDRFNASIAGSAGGVVSTAHDVSAFQRAFTQGRLLPPELQRVLTDRLPGGLESFGKTRSACGDDLYIAGGTGPGFLAMTFYSADGRRQFAVSATLSGKDTAGAGQAMGKAMETVFCPSS
ncbi:serine hydrolase domain-containing protein [Actinomadura hibisca]|uniref:serine hydrolase domain-containing protein n=1 Tax=Actinomadura hibisca TaxID=68565 RepID=UPI0008299D7C|nr:serine hydrolase domain-containing protein [Actinomadura hibisca]